MNARMIRVGPAVALAAALAAGCNPVYYRTMEMLGKHKRDLLVENVEGARDAQEEAKQDFRTALQKFRAVVEFDGGDLELLYKDLKGALDLSEGKAEAVRKRIEAVDTVAGDLFDEWEEELAKYTDDELRLSSEIKLRQTQMRFARLMRAMRRAESKMEPVLAAFRDQVLFLKHNLNARAVAGLEGVAASLESDVARLLEEMEVSIAEANAFIEQMSAETSVVEP